MNYRTGRPDAARAVRAKPKSRDESLTEARFQALLMKAGAFFAEAERDVEAERAAMIVEIL